MFDITRVLFVTGTMGLLTLTGPAAVLAESPERGGRRGPPPEAIEACASGQEGLACGFTSPRGDALSGQCLDRRGDLVCVPEGHERRRGERGVRGEEETPE